MQKARRKRRSKYDVAKIYEGSSSRPYFTVQPGISSFYNKPEEKAILDTNDPSLNLRPQKDRTVFTYEQMFILERAFQIDKHPGNSIRESVARLAGLDIERVRIWYQNRRAKEKRDEEDRLAMLADKFNNEPDSAYSTRPYTCRSTIRQKLCELDQIFDKKRHRNYWPSEGHSKFHSRRSRKYHPYETSYRNSLETQERHFENVKEEHNELECVKNLLRSPSEKLPQHPKRRLPGINTLNHQLRLQNTNRDYNEGHLTFSSMQDGEANCEEEEQQFIKNIISRDAMEKSENKGDYSSRRKRYSGNEDNILSMQEIRAPSAATKVSQEDTYSAKSMDRSYHEPSHQTSQQNILQHSLSSQHYNGGNLLNPRNLLEQLQRVLYTTMQSGYMQTSGNCYQSYPNISHPVIYGSQRDVQSQQFQTQKNVLARVSPEQQPESKVVKHVYKEIQLSNDRQ